MQYEKKPSLENIGATGLIAKIINLNDENMKLIKTISVKA